MPGAKYQAWWTEADWQNWHQGDFDPYLDVVFEAFGANA